MKKTGKKAAVLSIYERHQKQREAQAKREEVARQQELQQVNHANSDIELNFSDDSDKENEQVLDQVLPRKVLKSSTQQSPSSAEKQAHAEQHKTKALNVSARKSLAVEIEKASGPKKADQAQDLTTSGHSAEHPAAESERPEDRSLHAECEVPGLEPLDKEALRACLPGALELLKERLLDSRGGSEHPLTVRPSLAKLQQSLEALLKTTVDVPGENNSVLVVGPRGVGKTLAVERSIAAVEHAYNTNDSSPRVGVVRLTGLAHTEERAAFREIARQLCRSFKCQFSKAASFEDNLDFLRDMLKELRKGHKVVIFVLDEFDMFARKPKQALLYNLLDAMQAADMQAAVVGISCRSDVTEMLEKRVRSRFSYRRQLVLDPSTCAFENPEEGPATILTELLSLPATSDSSGSASERRFAAHFNNAVKTSLQDDRATAALRMLCFKGLGSPRELVNVALQSICQMDLKQELVSADIMTDAIKSLDRDQYAQVEAVNGLSVLELFVLVAVFRLRRKGYESPNFEMAFDEYSSLRRGGSYRGVDETAPRSAAFRAFERILAAALLCYSDSRAGGRAGLREFYPVAILLTQQELEQGIRSNPKCPPVLLEWLRKDALVSHAADD